MNCHRPRAVSRIKRRNGEEGAFCGSRCLHLGGVEAQESRDLGFMGSGVRV